MTHIRHLENTQTIWYDGCPECDARGAGLPATLHELDGRNRVKAWHYMRAWSWTGGQWAAPRPSLNDQLLFAALYSIGVFLQRAGIQPDELERRMIEQHDHDIARSRLSLEPIGPDLRGIDIAGHRRDLRRRRRRRGSGMSARPKGYTLKGRRWNR